MNESPAPLSSLRPAADGPAGDPVDAEQADLWPALFSAYRDLSRLRHDYPLVLVGGDGDGGFVRSLSDIIDGLLQEVAPRGIAGERLRKHVLALEEEIRTLASRGRKGSLLRLWDLAETNLLSRAGADGRESLGDSLSRARVVLRLDGEVIGCDGETPAKVLTHAWTVVQEGRARDFRERVDALILRLSDILKADAMRSGNARSAETLRRSMGAAYEAAFDFDAMSEILQTACGDGRMADKRRRRIRAVLSTLESQRFYAPAGGRGKTGRRKGPHVFVFERCTDALDAFRERLPEMVEFVKAMSIAELEIENRYRAPVHDAFFRRFDESFLQADDLALFPSYLVCLGGGPRSRPEKAGLAEALSSGLPIKVLSQSDDILEDLSIASGQLSLGIRASQPAATALGLNNAYVLQTSASGLYRLRESILVGLRQNRPALFSVFSGLAGKASASAGNVADVPPYLRAAAATESRAFPTFVYDPEGGGDWASRFSIAGNPQADAEWPVHRFCYEDEDLQRISEDVAFTFVDFVASDRRYAGCFERVPRSAWHDGMVPLCAFLDLEAGAAADKVPYVLTVDANNRLHRAVVADTLIHAARRCRDMWRSLRELGGIDNSHARRLLAQEKEAWEEAKEREIAALQARPEPPPEAPTPPDREGAAAPPQEAALAEAAGAAEAPADEPYIETPRCTTCNECTEINNRMFAYDDNEQAYIADPDAGTFRELVEAAENCQVCIIHPGKPRNPNEPGLEELIARAEPFN